MAVGGDSAGGNLAAVVARRARDAGGPRLVHQLLIHPATDGAGEYPSVTENATGYFLTRGTMQWFWNHYSRGASIGTNPDASPMYAESLKGLPPATVITAEFDPLRDEGEAYAKRLGESGVATTLTRYDGMVHGFFGLLRDFDDARRALDEAATALKAAFA